MLRNEIITDLHEGNLHYNYLIIYIYHSNLFIPLVSYFRFISYVVSSFLYS